MTFAAFAHQFWGRVQTDFMPYRYDQWLLGFVGGFQRLIKFTLERDMLEDSYGSPVSTRLPIELVIISSSIRVQLVLKIIF